MATPTFSGSCSTLGPMISVVAVTYKSKMFCTNWKSITDTYYSAYDIYDSNVIPKASPIFCAPATWLYLWILCLTPKMWGCHRNLVTIRYTSWDIRNGLYTSDFRWPSSIYHLRKNINCQCNKAREHSNRTFQQKLTNCYSQLLLIDHTHF